MTTSPDPAAANAHRPGTTVGEILRAGTRGLAETGMDSPRLDAEILLCHVLGWDRTTLFLRAPEPIAPDAVARFDALIRRRLAGEPVAYLTGQRGFLGIELDVSAQVLVPRPETELLVEWARDWLLGHHSGKRVVDVGTGSGAIALGLASLLPTGWNGTIVGIDVSPPALSVAIANRDRLAALSPAPGVVSGVTFSAGDLLDGMAGPLDLVLANLPYLTPGQVDGNPDLAAEPRLALDGGPDGLDLIRRLVGQAVTLLSPAGAIALELDPIQAAAVADLLDRAWPDARVETHRDLAGLDRFVTADRWAGHHH